MKEQARKKTTLEARAVERVVSVFLAGMADSADLSGNAAVARLLRRRSRTLQPASLIHNGRKGKK